MAQKHDDVSLLLSQLEEHIGEWDLQQIDSDLWDKVTKRFSPEAVELREQKEIKEELVNAQLRLTVHNVEARLVGFQRLSKSYQDLCNQRAATLEMYAKEKRRIDWVSTHPGFRIQGNDEKQWCILDCRHGIHYLVVGAPTYRDAVDRAMVLIK